MTFQTMVQKQEVDVANADVITRRENILAVVQQTEEQISVLGDKIRELDAVVVEKEIKAKEAIEESEKNSQLLKEMLSAVSSVKQSKEEEDNKLVQAQMEVNKAKIELEKMVAENKKQAETNESLKQDLLSLQRAKSSVESASLEKIKALDIDIENRLKDMADTEKTIELFYQELEGMEAKKIAESEEIKLLRELVDDKKKYLEEMEDSVRAAEQKYASVLSTGEQKLKDLLTAIEMNAAGIEEREATALKKENAVAQKEVWLEEKENTLRNIKMELEKHYNKAINHVII